MSSFLGLQLLTRMPLGPSSPEEESCLSCSVQIYLISKAFPDTFNNVIRTRPWVPKACGSYVGWQSRHCLCFTVNHLLAYLILLGFTLLCLANTVFLTNWKSVATSVTYGNFKLFHYRYICYGNLWSGITTPWKLRWWYISAKNYFLN